MTFPEHVKFVIRGLKFVFSEFFPCRLKNWMPLQCLKKNSNEAEESEELFPTIQKDEKSALLSNSVNSIIPSNILF